MSAFYLTRRICNGYVFARPLFRDVLRPTTPSEAFAWTDWSTGFSKGHKSRQQLAAEVHLSTRIVCSFVFC